jgi:predicted nucleic-acid-binding Zn-ribbon protein
MRDRSKSWYPPRCPKCGSWNVREWGTVYIGYDVTHVSDGGDLEVEESAGDLCVEDYQYEDLMCRECDYQDEDPTAWIPRPDVLLGEN